MATCTIFSAIKPCFKIAYRNVPYSPPSLSHIMKKLVSFLICLLFAVGLYAQPGAIDLTFNPGDLGFGHGDGPNNYVEALANQPDGKILIGGIFTNYNGIPRSLIARLHSDGTLDQTFDPGTGFYHDYGSSSVYRIEVLANGKLLVGGKFNIYNGHAVNNLVQLNTDGSLDAGFNTGTGPNKYVSVTRQKPDGRILIGGSFTSYNGTNTSGIARLHPDGSIDDSFQGPNFMSFMEVMEIQLQEDGSIMIGGRFTYADGSGNHYIVRLLENGSVDPVFNTNLLPVNAGWEFPFVRRIYITDQNKYLVAGRVAIPDQFAPYTIFQLNEDGSFDEEFQIPAMTLGSFESPSAHMLLPWAGDKWLIGGNFSSINGMPCKNIALINKDGTLDTTFSSGDITYIYRAIRSGEGHLLIAPGGMTIAGNHLARINEEFYYDYSFNPGTGANHLVNALHLKNDGKIMVSGYFAAYNGIKRKGIARLLSDGNLDTSFDPGDGFEKIKFAYAINEQADGKILAGGNFTDYNESMVNRLMRLNSDGSLDNTFNIGTGASNTVWDIKILDADKIIVAGAFKTFNDQPAGNIVRLNQDGSIDESFNTGYGANSAIICMAGQPDGKINIGGTFTMFDSISYNRIARVNPDGSLDMDFDPGSGFQSDYWLSPIIYALGLQQSGKIIAAGSFYMFDDIPISRIVRLNTNGSLDTTFTPGYGAIGGSIIKLLIQSDDKIIIGGRFTMFDSIPVGDLARLNPDGSLDTTFHSGTGFNNSVEAMALQDDGNILVGGWFTGYDGTGRNRIARIIGAEPDGVRIDFNTALMKVYPNPAQDFIYVEVDRYLQGAMIRLYDLQGRVVAENSDSNGQTFRFDIAKNEQGVYIIEVRTSEFVGRQKVIRY